jgi:glycosyltransferase involved in cell wall biosynthesis
MSESNVLKQPCPITAVILTFNNADIIERTLLSVRFCREVVVVDSGSTDGTRELCTHHGALVYTRDLDGFASQRNYGATQATSPWILALDSDEEITPELALEMSNTLAGDPETSAYQVNLINHFLGTPIHYRSGPSGFGAKLYRKDRAHFAGSIHEHLVISGSVVMLGNPILSYCQKTIRSVVASYNMYTDREAGEGCGVTYWQLIYPPIRRFIGHFFILGAFREGKRGFIKAVLDSFYAFLLAAKRWEKTLPPSTTNT